MTHDTQRTTDNEWGMAQVPHRGAKKSELDLTIIASILGVGVLYLKFGTLQEKKFGIYLHLEIISKNSDQYQ